MPTRLFRIFLSCSYPSVLSSVVKTLSRDNVFHDVFSR